MKSIFILNVSEMTQDDELYAYTTREAAEQALKDKIKHYEQNGYVFDYATLAWDGDVLDEAILDLSLDIEIYLKEVHISQ